MAASQSPGAFGSDENDWFGQDDVEAERRVAESVAAVGAKIIGAKPFPIAARRLEELTRNPKARLEQVVSVLETDPGLSLRLLRLVNSAGYGLKVRVTSVRHAAVLVGTRRLHHVATTAAILDLFDAKNQTAFELLEHASVVGSLCRYLGVHLGLPHDELFTCGFLHDIGKLMLLDTEPQRYGDLVRNFGGGADQLHPREHEMFGFDHAMLGAHVLRAWNIPEPVPKVISCHHQPSRAMQEPAIAALVQTLRLADQLSYALALETDSAGISLAMSGEAPAYLDISEAQMAALWPDLRALSQRSRDRSKGDDLEIVAPRRIEVPRSLRPRRSSLPPRSQRPSLRASPMPSVEGEGAESAPQSLRKLDNVASARPDGVHEIPEHFACVACSKPSYGNRCAACNGYCCPEHQTRGEQWCTLCVREFERFRAKKQVPTYLKIGALTLAGFSVGASLTGAFSAPQLSLWKLVLGPASMLLLWAVLLPVGFKFWQRVRFLRSRPRGRAPLPIKLPKPDAVFISELDANLDGEGMLGPSLVPPRVSAAPNSTPEITLDMVPHLASVSEDLVRTLDRVAEELESSSGLLAAAPVEAELSVRAPESESRLIASAAAIVEPQAVVNVAASSPSLAPQSPHPHSLPPVTLSRFPSTESGDELEAVVSAVAARLRGEAQIDYSGPSAGFGAAGREASSPAGVAEGPRTLPARADDEPAPVLVEAAPVITPDVLPQPLEPPVLEREAVPDSHPAAALFSAPPSRAGELARSTQAPAAAPAADADLEADITPSSPVAEPAESPLPRQPVAEPIYIVPRANLAHGCRAQVEYHCAAPSADACSVLPRDARAVFTTTRTSSDPAGPSTLRGLGE